MARGSRETENEKCVSIDSSISLVRMRRTSIISLSAQMPLSKALRTVVEKRLLERRLQESCEIPILHNILKSSRLDQPLFPSSFRNASRVEEMIVSVGHAADACETPIKEITTTRISQIEQGEQKPRFVEKPHKPGHK